MKVFKFGGASISTVDGYKNVANIIDAYKKDHLLVIISAMGKTTNALEKVVDSFFNKDGHCIDIFHTIKESHLSIANELLSTTFNDCKTNLNDFFTEIEWLLHDSPVREYDYYYDQIVCAGEMMSTTIMSFYLKEKNIDNNWIDVRDLIRTDNNFRDANIDWTVTTNAVKKILQPSVETFAVTITQGFVGATDENESTTLGREGSDYTAAVFANLLDAESQTIWKDVASVMNADPRVIADAISIPELNYAEVIEMAYYGAQVIHPKTIKPLQNKGIPLYVKCFLDTALPGTVIHNEAVKNLPPIIVIKNNQVMIEFKTLDYSFVGEKYTAALYHLFEKYSLRPTLTQSGAISMICTFDNRETKIQQLALEASELFDIQVTPELSLLTIRHYTPETKAQYILGKQILIEQTTTDTLLALYH